MALKIFWIFMLLCAGTVLIGIWVGEIIAHKLVPTFFIIGFASFLIWAPIVIYRFLAKPY